MKYQEDRFVVKNEQGDDLEFYKMVTFSSKITNKTYIVYSDIESNIYASILNNNSIEKIIDEIDTNEVNKALIELKMNIELIKESTDGTIIS